MVENFQYGGCVYRTAKEAAAAQLVDFATACGSTSPSEALVYLHDTCESAIRNDLAQAEWVLACDDEDFEEAREAAMELIRSGE